MAQGLKPRAPRAPGAGPPGDSTWPTGELGSIETPRRTSPPRPSQEACSSKWLSRRDDSSDAALCAREKLVPVTHTAGTWRSRHHHQPQPVVSRPRPGGQALGAPRSSVGPVTHTLYPQAWPGIPAIKSLGKPGPRLIIFSIEAKAICSFSTCHQAR